MFANLLSDKGLIELMQLNCTKTIWLKKWAEI